MISTKKLSFIFVQENKMHKVKKCKYPEFKAFYYL